MVVDSVNDFEEVRLGALLIGGCCNCDSPDRIFFDVEVTEHVGDVAFCLLDFETVIGLLWNSEVVGVRLALVGSVQGRCKE